MAASGEQFGEQLHALVPATLCLRCRAACETRFQLPQAEQGTAMQRLHDLGYVANVCMCVYVWICVRVCVWCTCG
jgi:hypothetical protein